MRKALKFILRIIGYSQKVKVYNRYQNRWDETDTLEIAFANHNQQQAFCITLPDGTKSFGQPGHYFQ
jgi:hypothetical protein